MRLAIENSTFFPWVQILIFLHKATQGDHIRLLCQFEKCTKNFGRVESCGYMPPSFKYVYVFGLQKVDYQGIGAYSNIQKSRHQMISLFSIFYCPTGF